MLKATDKMINLLWIYLSLIILFTSFFMIEYCDVLCSVEILIENLFFKDFSSPNSVKVLLTSLSAAYNYSSAFHVKLFRLFFTGLYGMGNK